MSHTNNKREPLFTWKALLFLGGAAIWAASQNWIEMARFYQAALENWRDFLRVLWSEVLSVIHFPLQFQEHQIDLLSVISILLASFVVRKRIGTNSPTLFDPSTSKILENIKSSKTEEYDNFTIALKTFHVWSTGLILYILIITPFADTVKYTHNINFIIFFLLSASFFLAAIFYVIKLILFIRQLKRWGAAESFQRLRAYIPVYLRTVYGNVRSAEFLITMSLILVTGSALIGFSVIAGPSASNFASKNFDSTPFDPWKYLAELPSQNIVDLTLIIICFFSIFLASGRSLRPALQFVLLGIILVTIGAVSKAVLKFSETQQDVASAADSKNEQAHKLVESGDWTVTRSETR